MALILHTKDGTKRSNAILYGGEYHVKVLGEVCETEIFFIESDYGNHFHLTWDEIQSQYTIGGWRDYNEWRFNKQNLMNNFEPLNSHKPNIVEEYFDDLSKNNRR